MNNSTLNKIWSFLGLAGLILSVNSALATQGAGFIINFSIQQKENQKIYAVAVYGMMLSIPIFILFLLVTHTYIYKNSMKRWYEKYPTAFNIQHNHPSLDFKIYQAFFIFLFVIATLYSQSHLFRIFVSGTAYIVKNEQNEIIKAIQITNHFFNSEWGLINERYKYACDDDIIKETGICKNGMSYYPMLQAWGSLLLVFFCYVLVIDMFIALHGRAHFLGYIYRKLVRINSTN